MSYFEDEALHILAIGLVVVLCILALGAIIYFPAIHGMRIDQETKIAVAERWATAIENGANVNLNLDVSGIVRKEE